MNYQTKTKVGGLENIKMEIIKRRMMKEVVGCVQILVEKKKFLVQFEYG